MEAPLATLEVLSARSADEPLGTVAMPVRDHLNTATAMSLLRTDFSFSGGIGGMDIQMIQGSILTLQRNEAVQKMRGEFLLFIDDDMVFEPDALERLVDTHFWLNSQIDEPHIVGGLCFRRTPPYQPTMYMRQAPTNGGYNFLEDWKSDVVEVDATGCAFLLIPRVALEAIAETEMPPYEERIKMTRLPNFFRWEGAVGEDLRFCQDFKAVGGRIFIDTRIAIGHISEISVGYDQFLQGLANRPQPIESAQRKINQKLGLPTMSRTRARKKLGWS